MDRYSKVTRKTNETNITINLNLDGTGEGAIESGIGFFDHMLETLKKHAGFNLAVEAEGDLAIDGHHTVEDIGIVLGQAFHKALGDRKGIVRFGHAYCPMDEALARAVVDISGRPFFDFECDLTFSRIGEFDGELLEEFLRAFAINAKLTLHVTLLKGRNQHHAQEAMVKAVARALRMAVSKDEKLSGVPSTKGVL